MASVNETTCPPPFISDADFQRGGGYVQGRFCGINPSATPGQKCCLPCPVQDWVYPAAYVRRLKVANYVGISSVALCGLLLVSFLVLPPSRSSRHYLTVGVTLAITFFSVPFVVPLGTDPAMCHDRITPNGQGSDASCAWTGALLLLGAMGSALWILFRALWLHLRVCWDIDPGRPFMILSILAGIVVPVAFTAVSMTVTGVSYRTGLVCLPNHNKAIVTFWAWEVGFAGAALLVQGVTTGYCLWVFLRVLVRGKRGGGSERASMVPASSGSGPGHSSLASEGSGLSAERPRKTWRQVRRIMLLQWRQIALTVVMAVESLFYIIVFVAQDTRFGEVAAKANEPEAKTWSACLVLTGGDRVACMQYAEKLAISQDLVLGSLLLGSLIGTQNFLLLAKSSIFIGWWELLGRPFSRFDRRGSDLPLTSLKPPEKPEGHALRPNTAKPSTANTQDYGTNGTTPLMATNSSAAPSRASILFGGGHRLPRSRSSHRNSSSTTSSSSFHGIAVDMPPVTVNNPYKLSLPSERAASQGTNPAERARLARVGDIVDLHNLYATDVRDDRQAFNAARPATPPPPPLPLNIAKSLPRTTSTATTGSKGGPGTSAVQPPMATSAASLSLPSRTPSPSSSFSFSFSSSTPPALRAGVRAHDNAAPPPPSSSSLPLQPTASSTLLARSATVHTQPPQSHTPDFLRPSRSIGNLLTPTTATATAATTTVTTAAVDGGSSGVANRHRLPSWVRGGGSSSTMTADLRDAMRGRGGLALHPVRADDEFGGAGGLASGNGNGNGGGGGEAESGVGVGRGRSGGGGGAGDEAAGMGGVGRVMAGGGTSGGDAEMRSGGSGRGGEGAAGGGGGVVTTLKEILDQGPGGADLDGRRTRETS